MIIRVSKDYYIPPNGNPGIVPPWLQKPPVIILPVEPEEPVMGAVLVSSDNATLTPNRV